MEYDFRKIEQSWQQQWKNSDAYKVPNQSDKPKFYVLDMFPYPSGAGLHVGHPLGYIASDIYSRYKRLKGFNVLHPMGYDAFGLPAEQYAIEHGVHPAISTANNIDNFRKQLDNIGFSYDWDREVRTSDPSYYKWTQWIFLQLFHSFFNRQTKKAEPIAELVKAFVLAGNAGFDIPNEKFAHPKLSSSIFSAEDWAGFDEKTKQTILMEYRLAYCGYGEVNWCEALGTVLANDEVVNGVSERGGHPVVRKKLRQWYLRITEYADRLLEGLSTIDFSEAMKEMQTNWIGKSYGAEIEFEIASPPSPLLPEKGASVQQNPEIKTTLSNRFFMTADPLAWKHIKEFGRANRAQATEAEDLIWQQVRNNQLGYKVRRQHTIGEFIIDFAFLQNYLLIEIDGGYHETEEQKTYDAIRTDYLQSLGYTVLRFTNEAVTENLEVVIENIKTELTKAAERLQSDTPAVTISETGSGEAPLSARRGDGGEALRVYTTRPDTIFGVDFMVIAPEHELVDQIKTPEQTAAVDEYVAYVKSRSERERQAEKKISGCFTGAYALNPFNGNQIPIWISEYVLAGYGTGAIMAVPCGDDRDYKFAKHFNIPITNILGDAFDGENANPTKDAKLCNSGFLDGVVMRDAIGIVNARLEEMGIGKAKVNYRMRDAAFSRQRYWGEPFPVQWHDGVATTLSADELPLLLPEVDSYSAGPEGEGPLANIPEWVAKELETNTMPGYAGSSWYFLRYMDPHNTETFCDRTISDYWNQVDIYIGGTEHAVGHLLYSRLWTKALYDLGYLGFDEPFKKLVNQGMIQGSSRFVYRVENVSLANTTPQVLSFSEGISNFIQYPLYISHYQREMLFKGGTESTLVAEKILTHLSKNRQVTLDKIKNFGISAIHVDVNFVDGVELDKEAFKKWKNGEFENAEFITEEDGKYICGAEVEKMSKSKFNTVNPDELVIKYGADTFRMYEMFLGPVEVSKPWDTKGIEGVHRFLKKLWRLFFIDAPLSAGRGAGGEAIWNDETPNAAELKVLHKTIKKIEEDTERFSFNTAVSAFMIAVNDLADLKCSKKAILEPLVIMLTPYAPHIAEELYHILGNETPVLDAAFPTFQQQYVTESSKEYPVSINGKVRTNMTFALDALPADVEKTVLDNELVQKWMEGKPVKKVIFVKGKMINVVI